jgi:hypothetical protein
MKLVEDGLPHDQSPEICACAGVNNALRLQLSEVSQQRAISLKRQSEVAPSPPA